MFVLGFLVGQTKNAHERIEVTLYQRFKLFYARTIERLQRLWRSWKANEITGSELNQSGPSPLVAGFSQKLFLREEARQC
jgi:hypothetical protein